MKKQSLMVGLLPMYLLLGSTAANAQSVEEQLGYCAQIKNPLERLVCFDNLAAGKAVAYQGPAPTQAGTAAASSAVAEFGREHVADTTDADNAPSRIAITVGRYSKDMRGLLQIETSDGQVWQQTSSEGFPFDPKANYFIERGALSAYYLGRTDLNARTRVRRIK